MSYGAVDRERNVVCLDDSLIAFVIDILMAIQDALRVW